MKKIVFAVAIDLPKEDVFDRLNQINEDFRNTEELANFTMFKKPQMIVERGFYNIYSAQVDPAFETIAKTILSEELMAIV